MFNIWLLIFWLALCNAEEMDIVPAITIKGIPNDQEVDRLIKQWNHKSQHQPKELVDIKLFETDSQSFPYRLSVEFIDRVCSPNYHNVTFSHGSGSYLTDLVNEYRIGSDELFMQVEGASLQTLLLLSDDMCGKYSALFFVPVTGSHRLKVFRTRSQYTAVIENDPAVFPMMSYEVFLDVLLGHPLIYSSNPCTENSFIDGFWTVLPTLNPFSKSPIKLSSELEFEKRNLPLYTSIQVDTDMTKYNCAREVNRFRWNGSLCEIDQGEVATYITIPQASKLLTKRSIIFIGDSHVRGLADCFLAQSCGITKTIYKKGKTNMQIHNVRSADSGFCNGLTVAYLSLTKCDVEITDRISGFNFAVINCGHHPASKLHFSYAKYYNAVSVLLDGLHKKKYDPNLPYLMWLDINAQPLRQDKYVIQKDDWRTYHRLYLYRAIATKEIMGTSLGSQFPMEQKMDIIPAFASTLAMFDKMCDNAHYVNDIKMPQVQYLLQRIALHLQKSKLGQEFRLNDGPQQ